MARGHSKIKKDRQLEGNLFFAKTETVKRPNRRKYKKKTTINGKKEKRGGGALWWLSGGQIGPMGQTESGAYPSRGFPIWEGGERHAKKRDTRNGGLLLSLEWEA